MSATAHAPSIETPDQLRSQLSRMLLSPKSVAVIGASTDAQRIGGRPIAYMKARAFSGDIYPVNPKSADVQGLRAYASVADLPEAPDVALVAVAAPSVAGVVEELGRKGVRTAVLMSAGFSETGEEGLKAERHVASVAASHGIRVLGPNSLGIINSSIGWYGTFSPFVESGWLGKGNIAVASQSGAFGTHVLASARNRGIGMPIAMLTGNEADLGLGEAIHLLVEHPDVEVICAYAEGFSDPAALTSALAAAHAARKPVVMMKVGRSQIGRVAAMSHTGSLAGDDAVIDAVLGDYAVVRAKNAEEMVDIAYAASRRIYPLRNTLGVITSSGGAGVLISDAAEDAGVEMPELPQDVQRQLLDLVPFAAVRNPVDCTAQVVNDITLLGRFTGAMAGRGDYASLLAFFTHTGGAPRMAKPMLEQLTEVRRAFPDKLFAVCILAGPDTVAAYDQEGFLVFEDATRAVAAIRAMGQFGAAFARPAVPVEQAEAAPALPNGPMSEAAAKRLLAELGIPVVDERECASEDEAVAAAGRFGFPVVMKISSADIPHKTEIGGVLLNVGNEDGVREGYRLLLERARNGAPDARIDGVLVSRQLAGGVECIVGMHRDASFGPIAMFGLGGIHVEVLKDVVFRRCPFTREDAAEMIRGIRGAALLFGARGRPKADVDALAGLLSRLSELAAQTPGLLSIDLNPVFVMNEGEGAFVADALIEHAG